LIGLVNLTLFCRVPDIFILKDGMLENGTKMAEKVWGLDSPTPYPICLHGHPWDLYKTNEKLLETPQLHPITSYY